MYWIELSVGFLGAILGSIATIWFQHRYRAQGMREVVYIRQVEASQAMLELILNSENPEDARYEVGNTAWYHLCSKHWLFIPESVKLIIREEVDDDPSNPWIGLDWRIVQKIEKALMEGIHLSAANTLTSAEMRLGSKQSVR